MLHKVSQYLDITDVFPAASRAAGTVDGTATRLAKYYQQFGFHVSLGDKGASGTLVVKVQESPDGSTNWTDVTGATTGTLNANGEFELEVKVRAFKAASNYFRVEAIVAGNAVVFSCTSFHQPVER